MGHSIEDIHFQGESKLKKLSKQMSNPFWKSIMLAGAEMSKAVSYALPKKIALFPICNNPLFKIGNNTVKSTMFSNHKHLQVADLLTENGTTFLNCDSFNLQYDLNIREATFENVKKSIRDGATKIGISLEGAEAQCRPRQSILGHIATSHLKGCR